MPNNKYSHLTAEEQLEARRAYSRAYYINNRERMIERARARYVPVAPEDRKPRGRPMKAK